METKEKYTEALKLTPEVLARVASAIYDDVDDATIIDAHDITVQQLAELREWWRDELHELYQWSTNEADHKYGRGQAYSLGYVEGIARVYINLHQSIKKHPDYHQLKHLLAWRMLFPEEGE